jgi:hypothetical protein
MQERPASQDMGKPLPPFIFSLDLNTFKTQKCTK